MTLTARSEATEKAARARAASRRMGAVSTDTKNEALLRIADAIEAATAEILAVNGSELARARANGVTGAFLDRMELTPERVAAIARDALAVAALPDPIGQYDDMGTRPNGLQIGRVRVPLGVIGTIYESRPNVTVDIACICLKSGNAVVLRSGSDAHETSGVLAGIVAREAEAAGLPAGCVQFIESTDRDEVGALLRAHESIDLMVPRGGADLIRRVRDEATMPVVAGGIGVCHTYIDADADLEMATRIAVDAKVSRPSVCNAMDTLLVHAAAAERFVPMVAEALCSRGVTLHVDERAARLLEGIDGTSAVPVAPEDYDREWLSLDCSLHVVGSFDDALGHIEDHGSGHSEAIVTESWSTGQRFLREVDAAGVFINASTYFHDGGQFGLGVEVGISTQKMHARGPLGLRELTSYKWVVLGNGHTRG
ncbi:MAG: glutamate-5-semialdehyde dehydrogenase [Chloroflexi bacterium]|nr:glutamate-5-semialdehyde dehydrogenase [Chloroflexota bacterium]MQC28135.1 glutamate-5-semialdehyde dehydrogenase [Chloroflexota bacterium]